MNMSLPAMAIAGAEGFIPGGEAIENPHGVNIADIAGSKWNPMSWVPRAALAAVRGDPSYLTSDDPQKLIRGALSHTGWDGTIAKLPPDIRQEFANNPGETAALKSAGMGVGFMVGTGEAKLAGKLADEASAANKASAAIDAANDAGAGLKSRIDKRLGNSPSGPASVDPQDWADMQASVQKTVKDKLIAMHPDPDIASTSSISKDDLSPMDQEIYGKAITNPQSLPNPLARYTVRSNSSFAAPYFALKNTAAATAKGAAAGAARQAGYDYSQDKPVTAEDMAYGAATEAPWWGASRIAGEVAPSTLSPLLRGMDKSGITGKLADYETMKSVFKNGFTSLGGFGALAAQVTKNALHSILSESGTMHNIAKGVTDAAGRYAVPGAIGDIYGDMWNGQPSESDENTQPTGGQ
jgi:hypothetical protein